MIARCTGLGATDVPPIAPGYPNRLLDELHMAAILEDRRRNLLTGGLTAADLDAMRRQLVSVTYRQFLLGAARRSLCLRLWSFERTYSGGPQ